MKVSRRYYNEKNFHDPETVYRHVTWFNTYLKSEVHVPSKRVARQLKNMVIKRYSKMPKTARFIPLSEQWAADPAELFHHALNMKRENSADFMVLKGAIEINKFTLAQKQA